MPDSQMTVSVSLVEGRPATTSLKIAEHFDKPHGKVLRDIRKLIAECPEKFTEANFGLSEYEDDSGRKLPMYIVYFDGFMLLVMGYTGKKALAMKLAYIAAFNAMREKLENAAKNALPPSDAPLTPDQQCTLRAIVKSKVEAIPEAERPKGIYPQIWSRFNNYFRIAKYSQLPQFRLSEAIDYLVRMEIVEPKALPQQQALPRGAKKWIEMPEYAAKIDRLVLETQQKSNEFMKAVSDLGYALLFRPACLDDEVTDFGKELGHYLHSLGFAAQTTAKSMCEMAGVYRSQLGKQE